MGHGCLSRTHLIALYIYIYIYVYVYVYVYIYIYTYICEDEPRLFVLDASDWFEFNRYWLRVFILDASNRFVFQRRGWSAAVYLSDGCGCLSLRNELTCD